MRKRLVAADSAAAHTDDLFRSRLENQIDLRHPLAQLAQRMPWAALEEALTPTLPPDPAGGGRPSLNADHANIETKAARIDNPTTLMLNIIRYLRDRVNNNNA